MSTVRLAREFGRVGGVEVRYQGVSTSTKPRDQLVLGVDMPGPGLCGLTDSSVLVDVNTATTYGPGNSGTAGNPTIVSNKRFNRRVSLSNVQYIRFVNCMFRGEPSTPIECMTSTNAGNLGIEFFDCKWSPQNPSYLTNANRGTHNTRYLRCEFEHLIDGLAHTNSGSYTADQRVSIEQCWFHDYWYASPDPGAAGGEDDNASHVDVCIQWRGGPGLYVGGNRIDGLLGQGLESLGSQVTSFTDPTFDPSHIGSDAYRMTVDVYSGGVLVQHRRGNKYFDYIRDSAGNVINPPTLEIPNYRNYGQATSLFMFSPIIGPMGAMLFEKNWLDGGSASFNFNPSYTTVASTPVADTRLTAGQVIIRNNKWGPMDDPTLPPSMRNGTDWAIVANSALPLTITGNIRTDTGAAYNARKNG